MADTFRVLAIIPPSREIRESIDLLEFTKIGIMLTIPIIFIQIIGCAHHGDEKTHSIHSY
jgi:hypothetical protein